MPKWIPLPEYSVAELTLEKMQALAKSLQPFALTGMKWESDAKWKDTEQFFNIFNELSTGEQGEDESAEITIGQPSDMTADFVAASSDEMPLQAATSLLSASFASPEPSPLPLYMKYSIMDPALLVELPFHSFYTKKQLTPVELPILLKPETFFTWAYIGTKGSGSATHIDILNSSAWLTLLHGSKKWLLVHGEDHERVNEVAKKRSHEEEEPKPNLFSIYNEEGENDWDGARFYEYQQKPGTAMFVPSKAWHAVFNNEDSTSLTHNFVDETNQEFWGDAIKSMMGV